MRHRGSWLEVFSAPRISIALFSCLALGSQVAHAADPVPEDEAASTAELTSGGPASARSSMPDVHINSPRRVALEHRSSPNAPWEIACTSPCNVRLPAGDEYRIAGTGIRPSKSFMLDTSDGMRVVLSVEPGVDSKYKVGLGVAGGGAALLLAGVITLAVASTPSETFSADGKQTNVAQTNVLTASIAMMLGGVCAGIVGGSWALQHHNTSVDGKQLRMNSTGGLGRESTQASAPASPASSPGLAFVVPVINTSF